MSMTWLCSVPRLDVAVRKLRRGMGRSAVWDKEQLVEHVMQAKDDYPAEKLAEMWDYKSYIMGAVLAAKGGNDYDRHRP